MSDLNPDTCMLQLAVAKKAISDNDATIKQMAVETAQKEAEATVAEANYEQKKEEYENAKTSYNNFKNNDRSWRKQEGRHGCISTCQ